STSPIYTLSLHDALPISRDFYHARRSRIRDARVRIGGSSEPGAQAAGVSGSWISSELGRPVRKPHTNRDVPGGQSMVSADILVIGAGHNGLVAANYLAKAGLR